MADLDSKFNQILNNIEKNIKNKDELETIKTDIFELYNLFSDEIERIEKYQETLKEKVCNLENRLNSMEEELFIDDEENEFLIACPYCNNEFYEDYDNLKDEIICPECNNVIELDWGEDEPYGCTGNCSGCKLHDDENEE